MALFLLYRSQVCQRKHRFSVPKVFVDALPVNMNCTVCLTRLSISARGQDWVQPLIDIYHRVGKKNPRQICASL